MKLRDYIDSFPRTDRTKVRMRLAKACQLKESAIKHYANGTRDVPARHYKALIAASDNAVTVEGLLSVYDENSSSAA